MASTNPSHVGKHFSGEGDSPQEAASLCLPGVRDLLTRDTIWRVYFTSLDLYFLINVMRIIIESTNRVLVKIKSDVSLSCRREIGGRW